MMHQSLTVTCKCGKIECKNITFRDALSLHIAPRTLEQLHTHKLKFSKLFTRSFIIHDKHCVSTRSHGPKCFGITCSCCHSDFYIFTDHSGFGLGMPLDSRVHAEPLPEVIQMESDPLLDSIPAVLKNYIFVVPSQQDPIDWDTDEIMEYDIDDDIMFSPTTLDCVVGSYEDRPMMLFSGMN